MAKLNYQYSDLIRDLIKLLGRYPTDDEICNYYDELENEAFSCDGGY